MKKILTLLLIFILSLSIVGCNETEQTPKPTVLTRKDIGLAYAELDKTVYSETDTVNVELFNVVPTDYVGIFDVEGEPGKHKPIKKVKVGDATTISFSVSDLKLESMKEYAVCIYQNKTFYSFDRVEFMVSDNELTDYKVSDVKLTVETNGNLKTPTITITPSVTTKLTYRLYWANNNVRLADYDALKTIVCEGSSFDVKLNTNIYMPKEANQIEVTVLEGKTTSYFLDLNDELKLAESKHTGDFQMFTDIHANDTSLYTHWHSHLYNAFLDTRLLYPNTSGIFTAGDNTDMGGVNHYNLFNKIAGAAFGEEKPDIYLGFGNHDYMYYLEEVGGYNEAVRIFKQQSGAENSYYTKTVNGYKYIFLCSDIKEHEGGIEQTQIEWFKNELKSVDKNEFAFVILHQPIIDTVAGSLKNQEKVGIENGEKIREILKDYPNVVMFNGHSHYALYEEQNILFGQGKEANYVNCGAVAYLRQNNEYGSNATYIEVYEDYILVRGRDIVTSKWISNAQYVIYKN